MSNVTALSVTNKLVCCCMSARFCFCLFCFRDKEIHISNLKDGGQDIILRGHDGPVIGVAVDPKDEYLVSTAFHLEKYV